MTSEIRTGFVPTFLTTLATMFGSSAASKYSRFYDVQLVNSGNSNLLIAVLPTGYAGDPVEEDFVTLPIGDSMIVPELDSSRTYIATVDDGESNVLQFNGEV